ncbi:MAG: iron donor protein CyaY [Janthinobacterium lividum]
MTDHEYLTLAEAALASIERSIDDAEMDIECTRQGSVLTLEFDRGGSIIVNLQAPMHEIWLAAKAGGYHFSYVDGVWHDARGGNEFFSLLSKLASEQAGEALSFRPPAASV